MRHTLTTLAAAALCLMPFAAASQDTGCTVSATAVDFGVVGLLDFAVDTTGDVTVTCPSGTAYTVGLDEGQAAAGPSGRYIASGTTTIPYGLYKDSARTELWGQQGDAAGPVSGTGSGSAQVFTVYGRIPAQSKAPAPGTYTDTITVTLTY